jgi:hypothetical protein
LVDAPWLITLAIFGQGFLLFLIQEIIGEISIGRCTLVNHPGHFWSGFFIIPDSRNYWRNLYW